LNSYGLGNIPVEQFQLWRDGKEVPIYTSVPSGPLPANGYIEFLGRPNTGMHEAELFDGPEWHYHPERSMFTDSAYYYLTVNTAGNNLRFSDVENKVMETQLLPDSFYMHTANPLASIRGFYGGKPIIVGGTSALWSSNWEAGEGFISGIFDVNRTLQFNLTGLRAFMNGPAMRIHYTAFGISNYSRDIILKMNDAEFDKVFISGINGRNRVIENIPLNGNLLNDGINFKFNSIATNSWEYDNNVLGRFLLTYPRQFFYNGQPPLEIALPVNKQGNHIRLQGLPNGTTPPVLYDFTNLKRYVGVIKQDSSLFAIEPTEREREIVIGTQVAAHLRTITTLNRIEFRDFSNTIHQGNYVIISNQILRNNVPDPVEAYREYRSSALGGGYNAKIYDIDELADQFCYGVRKNPLAIKRFIMFAVDRFSVKPQMVFLIGKGAHYFNAAWSTNNINRELLNPVPTWGTPSSDNLLASRNKRIPVPEIPISRLSVVYGSEIMDYLNKVKEFETLQRKRPSLPSDNEWRKKVLHLVGGDDPFTAEILEFHMKQNTETIRLPKIGANVGQYTRIDNENFAANLKKVENSINDGTGLIYYFGHSSTSSIDWNLGSPNLYHNTDGKYPVFIANGCRAGNIFDYNTSRLTAQEVTISENFTLSPDRGAIAFVSNSDLAAINYQSLLAREWYQAFSTIQFGKTIGEIHREALHRAWQRTAALNDRLNAYNLEQSILHGDPAIKPFAPTLPDFAVETKFLGTDPKQPLTELDSITINVKYFNIGAATKGDVHLQLERELPDGTVASILNKNIKDLFNEDSISVTIGLKGLFEEGNGFIVARIDPGGDWQETDKDNNVAILPFNLERNHIAPVYPYNYAIVNSAPVLLKASTTNPIQDKWMYTFQIDTSAHFNSPKLISKDTLATGGIIEWGPGFSATPDVVYYWRAFKTDVPFQKEIPVFSFVYKPGNHVGFNQSHYFQHKDTKGEDLLMAEQRAWEFGPRVNNLYVSHGIYNLSGFEDTHFAITVNGQRSIYSACLGRSIVFNLFDPVSFAPIPNNTGQFGNFWVCNSGREYNFEFRYFPTDSRKAIMDFLDAIPNGMYVAARLVVDPPVDSSFAANWKKDTAFFGSGNSLYHSLVKHGFYDLDSLNRHRTFFFMFKKGDSTSFKPISYFSRGVRDRVHASVFPTVAERKGTITSPWMGPANQWQEALWDIGFNNEEAKDNSKVRLSLWGKSKTGQRVELQRWDQLSDKIDISAIDAQQFPMLQFEMNVDGEEFGFDAPQLNYWQLYYDPLPDGAWSPSDHFTMNKDTLQPFSDILALQVAFKNASTTPLGQTIAKVYVSDLSNNLNMIYQQTFRSLQPNDTAILNLNRELSLPQGFYQLMVDVNENGNPSEQHYFNNRFIFPFVVDGGTLPIRFLRFDAQRMGEKVALLWEASRDNTIESYNVEYSSKTADFVTIVRDVRGSEVANDNLKFNATHDAPVAGANYYRLRLQHKDGTVSYSDVRKVIFENKNFVKALPNPFNEYFTIQPLDNNVPWQIRMVDGQGKIVHTEKGLGSKRIYMGNQASGFYILQWSSGDKVQNIKMVKQ
jgi:hypothetical protein